jgi:UDP-N-acetylglucosamine 2-epimerase (non-hydrolysing)
MIKILVILGTRPEAIKLAPIVRALCARPEEFHTIVGVTGQHNEILHPILAGFHIRPDFNLCAMKRNQTLADLTAAVLKKLGRILPDLQPDMMLVQGDTTTAFAAALTAFYQKIPIGHVEAGLRTDHKYRPFPEEINRRLTDQMCDVFFAPTEVSRNNLLKEGVPARHVYVTGNTVVDALLEILSLNQRPIIDRRWKPGEKMVLITVHRRESFGKPLQNIFEAIRRLSMIYPRVHFVYPVHPNPQVRTTAYETLSNRNNIHLIAPVDYISFVQLMNQSHFILTDSGGIQEEAPTLKKPVLILREETERPEVVAAGGAKLVGTHPQRIILETSKLLEDPPLYERMSQIRNPYGEGLAARKIVDILEAVLGKEHRWNNRTRVAS